MLPSREEALHELALAGELNPGPWTDHSRNVGRAARLIARQCGMDEARAETLGLLHDIGRRAGIVDIPTHILEGVRYCQGKGWDEAARVCLTHSYPIGLRELGAHPQGREGEIAALLQNVTFDDYDRLVCLCDSLALGHGFMLMEKRWVDVCRRYGVNEWTVPRWDALAAFQAFFEQKMGCSIYDVLPGVKETTFQPLPVWTPPGVNKA